MNCAPATRTAHHSNTRCTHRPQPRLGRTPAHAPPPGESGRKIFFDKLAKYIGQGIKALIDRPDGRFCFRLHRDRVYYVSEQQVRGGSQAAAAPP
jgi:hypothetical protein